MGQRRMQNDKCQVWSGPCSQPGEQPYPGDGQSRGSRRGRSLASSSAESMDRGKGAEAPETTDTASSPDRDWEASPDSTESSASLTGSLGMSSPSCSMLGEGLTICHRRHENTSRAAGLRALT